MGRKTKSTAGRCLGQGCSDHVPGLCSHTAPSSWLFKPRSMLGGETYAVSRWDHFPFLTLCFPKLGMHVCRWKRSCLWALVPGEGAEDTSLCAQWQQWMEKGFKFPRGNMQVLNHKHLENPVSLTESRENCTKLGCYLPDFQLTQSLFVMDFLVASRTMIYVQRTCFLMW